LLGISWEGVSIGTTSLLVWRWFNSVTLSIDSLVNSCDSLFWLSA
jgi:hypothetical protein